MTDPDLHLALSRIESALADLPGIRAALADLTRRLPAGAAQPEVFGQFLSVEEFSRATGRCTKWVYERIAQRRLAVRGTGKPYQIPVSEVARWTKARTVTGA